MPTIHVQPCSTIAVTLPGTSSPIPPEGAVVEHDAWVEERIREGTLEPVTPGSEGEGDDDDLAGMKVAELKQLAAEAGIEGAASMKKPELIAALEALEGEDDGEGAED